MSDFALSDFFAPARLVVSGLSGGGGKTLLSLGLSRALRQRGIRVKPYKKGPDYIDAAWLGLAADPTQRQPATNLDPFFLDDERLRALFQEAFGAADLAVIEGNRGLYDGRDLEGSCSTARLARALDAPIVLVLNCTKMTRTAAAIVTGLASFEPVRLAAVILNRVGSPRHALTTRRAIEQYCGIPVLGAIPRLPENPLPERHMGLCSIHSEHAEASDSSAEAPERALERLAAVVSESCDLDALLALGQSAPALPPAQAFWPAHACPQGLRGACARPRIGFVRDAALWFYYEENLEALRRAGADLVELSLLQKTPWPALDGLYLGGGFPEMLAERLAASPHLATIRHLSEQKRPVYAECGGFMLLCRSVRVDGKDHAMAGIFPAKAECCARPQGLGYVEARVVAENPFHPLGTELRGHEFHYSRCIALEKGVTTLHLESGVGMGADRHGAGQDGLLIRRTFAAYTHIFAPAVPHWAPCFVRACCESALSVQKRPESICSPACISPYGR